MIGNESSSTNNNEWSEYFKILNNYIEESKKELDWIEIEAYINYAAINKIYR
ncbi:24550_t:CDS:1, partial [Racocetra persica]